MWLLFFCKTNNNSTRTDESKVFLATWLIYTGGSSWSHSFSLSKLRKILYATNSNDGSWSGTLRKELEYLKNERRPEIIKAIAEAREHGDLKENAEYHAAREQQGFCEGRIQEIEGKLANCQIIDVTKIPNNGKVIFGATVVLVNTNTDDEVTYRIVGDDEADIKNGLISVNSPIARGLIGKEQDDVVNITTPGGVVEFEIIEVEYV